MAFRPGICDGISSSVFESCGSVGLVTEFENKIAIVTGTTGIGKATAKRLARGGARVLACGLDTAANEALNREAIAEEISIEVKQCDVSCAAEIEAAVLRATESLLGLDILVNAAAVHPYGTAIETDLETWNRCLTVNVTSIFLFAHFSVPAMRRSGGRA